MKKALKYLVSVVMVLMLLVTPNQQAYGANVTLGVSASTVNIGDSVTVTLTIPESVTGTVDLSFPKDLLTYSSASVEVGVNGGIITMNIGKQCVAGTNKVTVTFKAATSGTAEIKVTPMEAYDNDSLDEVTLGSASTKITIQNEVTSDDPDTKSADNSLKSLKLTAGSKAVALSPTFKSGTTKYTATVDYDVTSVVVSATANHKAASIESITGDGTVKLDVGSNVIKVVVQAENGKKATYKITVTRQEKVTDNPSSSESENPDPSESETPATPDFEVNGTGLYVTEDIPSNSIPVDFEEKEILLGASKEVTALSFKNGELTVLYLQTAENVGEYYIYNEELNQVYPFIKLTSEKNYVIVLMPDDVEAPEGYVACTLSIEGKGIVNAYQYQATRTVVNSDFYLLYCINADGELGWYQYDSLEGTYQRYAGIIPTDNTQTDTENPSDTQAGASDSNELQDKYNALTLQLEEAERLQRIIICVAVFVVAVLAIVIVNLLLAKRKEDEEDDEDEEYDDEDEGEIAANAKSEVKEETKVEAKAEDKAEDKSESKVEDEMTSKASQISSTNDGDELEFIDL